MENQDAKDFAGKNGFVWWTGVVEDRQDPLKLGRCRVRCVGWHSENKSLLPTNMLPWALPAYAPNHTQTYAPKDGDMVFGFFTDGENAQNPIMLGIFPKIPLKEANPQEPFSDCRTTQELQKSPRPPKSKQYRLDGSGITITETQRAPLYPRNDEMNQYNYHSSLIDEPTTPRIARNDPEYMSKTYIQERKDNVVKEVETYDKHTLKTLWNEPVTAYNADYPYNNVMETESGHIVEFDDTPGSERIHQAHRNGSFSEWYPNGDKVEKITRDNYTIVMKDDNLYIMGQCRITVQGDAEIYVQKNVHLRVDENVTGLVKGDVDIEVEGNVKGLVKKNADITVDGNVDVKVGGNFNERVDGTYTVSSGGNMSFTAPRIDLN
jgi:hypothetical protein